MIKYIVLANFLLATNVTESLVIDFWLFIVRTGNLQSWKFCISIQFPFELSNFWCLYAHINVDLFIAKKLDLVKFWIWPAIEESHSRERERRVFLKVELGESFFPKLFPNGLSKASFKLPCIIIPTKYALFIYQSLLDCFTF